MSAPIESNPSPEPWRDPTDPLFVPFSRSTRRWIMGLWIVSAIALISAINRFPAVKLRTFVQSEQLSWDRLRWTTLGALIVLWIMAFASGLADSGRVGYRWQRERTEHHRAHTDPHGDPPRHRLRDIYREPPLRWTVIAHFVLPLFIGAAAIVTMIIAISRG